MREVQPEIGVYKRLMAACSRILVAVHMALMVAKILRIREIITTILLMDEILHQFFPPAIPANPEF